MRIVLRASLQRQHDVHRPVADQHRIGLRRATSAPCPIASDTSARASTGASLTPSPTIATRSPRCCAAATSASLSCGVAPPTRRIQAELLRHAPARVRGCRRTAGSAASPAARSAAMASMAPSRSASSKPKQAAPPSPGAQPGLRRATPQARLRPERRRRRPRPSRAHRAASSRPCASRPLSALARLLVDLRPGPGRRQRASGAASASDSGWRDQAASDAATASAASGVGRLGVGAHAAAPAAASAACVVSVPVLSMNSRSTPRQCSRAHRAVAPARRAAPGRRPRPPAPPARPATARRGR